MPLVGGTTEAKPATPEVQELSDKIKAAAEEKAGKTFAKFEAKTYATQVVNGTNYFIKVDVGDDDHLHVRVHKSVKGDLTLHSLQENKSGEDALTYF